MTEHNIPPSAPPAHERINQLGLHYHTAFAGGRGVTSADTDANLMADVVADLLHWCIEYGIDVEGLMREGAARFAQQR